MLPITPAKAVISVTMEEARSAFARQAALLAVSRQPAGQEVFLQHLMLHKRRMPEHSHLIERSHCKQ